MCSKYMLSALRSENALFGWAWVIVYAEVTKNLHVDHLYLLHVLHL